MKSVDLIKEHYKEKGYREFLERYAYWFSEEANASDEVRCACPQHQRDDYKTPSCSFNLKFGRYTCFNSDCGSRGDVVAFYQAVKDIDKYEVAALSLAKKLGLVVEITNEIAMAPYKFAKANPDAGVVIRSWFKISNETIDKYLVGWDTRSSRITIPIRGFSGDWEDIRMYNKNSEIKCRSFAKGTGGSRVFPIENLKNNRIIIFEGEKDCLRALDMGIEGAITFTAGSGSLPTSFQNIFANKEIYLCYDVDQAGIDGRAKVAQRLSGVAKKLGLVNLPAEELPKKGDFSDWANLGYKKEDFELLVLASEPVKVSTKRLFNTPQEPVSFDFPIDAPDTENSGGGGFFGGNGGGNDGGDGGWGLPPEDEDPEEENFVEARLEESPNNVNYKLIDFSDITRQDLYGIRIRLRAHMIGSSVGLKVYQSPEEITVDCDRSRATLCARCPINNSIAEEDMPFRLGIDHTSEVSLQLIKLDSDRKKIKYKRLVGIPDRCDVCAIEETRRRSIHTLLLSPPIEVDSMRETVSAYTTAYYSGKTITDNRDYWFEGYLQADPKTQENVLNLEQAWPCNNILDDFKMTPEIERSILARKKPTDKSVEAFFEEMYDKIERMSGIYGRTDLQLGVFESIFSVLAFYVGSKYIENGWVENLFIGDTRTGKSEITRKIMWILNVGEFISGENASFAGLVGGIEYIEGLPIPVWGKYPQNDRGMIGLDEMGNIGGEILGKMSSMRSAGVAEINKIQQAKTPSRVRGVHICNPRKGQQISTFDGGIRAVHTVVRNLEDIARYAKIYVVSVDTVTVDTIVKDRKIEDDEEFRHDMNKLVMLTWSLTPEQVVFTESSNEFLRETARRLSGIYHASIPAWEKGSGLTKLAKLSVPIAAMCGSFIKMPDGRMKLVVDIEHCEYAVANYEENYRNEVNGYERYSKSEYAKEKIVDPTYVTERLLEYAHIETLTLLRFFASNDELMLNNFIQLIARRSDAEALWSMLISNNCLAYVRGQRDTLGKTPAFVRLLTRLLAVLTARAKETTPEEMKENKLEEYLAEREKSAADPDYLGSVTVP